MTFKAVPLNIIGGNHKSKSKPLSSQQTINLIPVFNDSGREKFTLFSFPGQKLLKSETGNLDRGQHVMNNVLYRVLDNKLYKVDSLYNHTDLGAINGVNRCLFTDDGQNLIIVSDSTVYVYDADAGTLTVNNNSNLSGVLSADVINSQILYTMPKITFIADVGQPTSISGLNGVGAESKPDDMVRDYVFNQTIFRFGQETLELWYNTGTGTPPIARIEGSMYNVGLKSKYSTASTDNALYWLGDDNIVYRSTGGQPEKVSNTDTSTRISKLIKTDDAIGSTFVFDGRFYYMLKFPAARLTLCCSEELGQNGWFELASTNFITDYTSNSIFKAYGKNLAFRNGDLVELRDDEYTEDSDTIIRQRTASPITNRQLGLAGRRVKMSKIVFDLEQGVGLSTGQGVDPKMMIEASYDGGKTFDSQDWVRLGRAGENTLQVEWYSVRSFYELTLRITISDPVPITIYGAQIFVKDGGR